MKFRLFLVFVFGFIGFSSAQNEPQLSTSTVKPEKVDLCPSPSEIEPCTCRSFDTKSPLLDLAYLNIPRFFVTTFCRGENVTELSFDNLINALHQKVRVVQEQLLLLSRDSDAQNQGNANDTQFSMELSNTAIAKLDLTSLIQTSLKVTELWLNDNFKLSTITGPSSSNISESNKIPCHGLEIRNSPVTDRDIGKILSFLDPEKLDFFQVIGTLVEGSGGKVEDKNKACPANPLESEFFPGLSAFTNLQSLWLDRNKIKVLRCSQFISQGKQLKNLYLDFNPLEFIGENGLLFTLPSEDSNVEQKMEQNNTKPFHSMWRTFTHVSIVNSSLDENTFMGNSGLDKNSQTILLRLRNNKFKSLPETLFRSFVEKPGNILHVFERLLPCDEKLKWIQEFSQKSLILVGKQNCNIPRNEIQGQENKTTVID